MRMGKVGAPYTFNVNKMLELRVLGWTYSKLGRYFHKDHTTIIYHCVKWGIVPFQKPPPVPKMVNEEEIIQVREKRFYKYADIFERDGPVNPGKSYKEYLKEASRRPDEKRYHDIYYKKYDGPPRNRSTRLTFFEQEARTEIDSESFGLVS